MAQKFRFRNIHGEPYAKWEDILPMGGTTDGWIVAGNSKFIAFPLQGGMGSTLGVLNYSQVGRVKRVSSIRAHSSSITDFKFVPYEENLVLTSSQDATIKLWRVEDENNQDINVPEQVLNGHALRVNLIAPHHAAKGILASSSYDKTIKIWDMPSSKDIFTVNHGQNYALALEWSHDGNLLGTTWNDKQVRIIDPRQEKIVREFGGHQSTRAMKFAWLGNSTAFITTGFDQHQKRQMFQWDMRNTSTHIDVAGCPQGQGILHPYFDNDLGILYLNGKGESLIRNYEFVNNTLTCHLNDFLATDTTKGYCFLPKYSNDTSRCEVIRAIKLCGKYAEAISFVYPRKSQGFNEELYPNCAGGYSLDDSSKWVHGQTVLPQLISMKDNSLANYVVKPSNIIAPVVTSPQALAPVNQPIVIHSTPIQSKTTTTINAPIVQRLHAPEAHHTLTPVVIQTSNTVTEEQVGTCTQDLNESKQTTVIREVLSVQTSSSQVTISSLSTEINDLRKALEISINHQTAQQQDIAQLKESILLLSQSTEQTIAQLKTEVLTLKAKMPIEQLLNNTTPHPDQEDEEQEVQQQIEQQYE